MKSISTSSTLSSSSKRKTRTNIDGTPKIPRPSNSFMLYRKDRAKLYPKLVATELSAKIAADWRDETPKVRTHYGNLADEAKEKHLLQYPDYKFTPKKRGTGKRAQAKLAAAISADIPSYPSSSSSTSSCSEKRSPIKREPASPSPPAKTSRSKKQRRSSASPYAYPSEHSTYSTRKSAASEFSSLFLYSRSAAERTRSRSRSSQLQDAMDSLELSEPPSCSDISEYDIIKHSSSDDDNDNVGNYGNDDIDEEDDDEEANYENKRKENNSTPQVPPAPSQPESLKEESTLFTPVVLPPLLASEPFEPECLANAEWKDTMSGHCSSVSAPALTSCSTALLEPSVLALPIPSYEIYFSSVQRSLIMECSTAYNLSSSTEMSATSDVLIPVYLYSSVIPHFLGRPRFAPIQIPSQPRITNQDLVMSPGLVISTPSFQDALKWLGTAIGPERS
ncbi:hypothetical protein BGX26_005041 [Mortierella sp. AD094]|nr:hypothetical protein BGX26_005041 [Mortierella sp. AD094]